MADNDQILKSIIEELEERQDVTVLFEWRTVLAEWGLITEFDAHETDDIGEGRHYSLINPAGGDDGMLFFVESSNPSKRVAHKEAFAGALRILKRCYVMWREEEQPAEVNTQPNPEAEMSTIEAEYVPTKPEARLLDLLRTEGAMSLAGIVDRLECSERHVQRSAMKPKQLGYIVTNAGRYSATIKADELSL